MPSRMPRSVLGASRRVSQPGGYKRVVVAALSLVACLSAACGDPLEDLPPDTLASVSVDVFSEGGPMWAFLYFETQSCLQLEPTTTFRFQGIAPSFSSLGGRDNNPLSAYFVGFCEAPQASWDNLPPAAQGTPYRFELENGDLTLVIELDEEGFVTRCDFPNCISDAERAGPVQP